MVAVALSAFIKADGTGLNKPLVSVIFSGGCPLDCPYCFLSIKDEGQDENAYTPSHYTAMLDAFNREGNIGAAAIVGEEPLQENCWEKTVSFLRKAKQLGVRSALITNGFYLEDFAGYFSEFPETQIIVSVDGVGTKHDLARRKEGAFARLEKGLAALRLVRPDMDNVEIATVLRPGHHEDVKDVLDFVVAQNVFRWAVTPLLKNNSEGRLAAHPKLLNDKSLDFLKNLHIKAIDSNVDMVLSDEFALLSEWKDKLRATGLPVIQPRPEAGLIRVDAKGKIYQLNQSIQDLVHVGDLPVDQEKIQTVVKKISKTITAGELV